MPFVLMIGDRHDYYEPAPISRHEALYDTNKTVRVVLDGKRQGSPHRHKVDCLPNDGAFAEIVAFREAFCMALGNLPSTPVG